MIETERLILRPPEARDRAALAVITGAPRVGDWLAATLTPEQNDAMIERVLAHQAKHGFCLWAAERKADGTVIGMAGLMAMGADLPPGPALEVGWRLAPETWGQGYATEGARACLDWGFANRDMAEIIAITAATNRASQAVMLRLGMTPDPSRDFAHPKLADDHPLKAHVTYAIKRPA